MMDWPAASAVVVETSRFCLKTASFLRWQMKRTTQFLLAASIFVLLCYVLVLYNMNSFLGDAVLDPTAHSDVDALASRSESRKTDVLASAMAPAASPEPEAAGAAVESEPE